MHQPAVPRDPCLSSKWVGELPQTGNRASLLAIPRSPGRRSAAGERATPSSSHSSLGRSRLPGRRAAAGDLPTPPSGHRSPGRRSVSGDRVSSFTRPRSPGRGSSHGNRVRVSPSTSGHRSPDKTLSSGRETHCSPDAIPVLPPVMTSTLPPLETGLGRKRTDRSISPNPRRSRHSRPDSLPSDVSKSRRRGRERYKPVSRHSCSPNNLGNNGDTPPRRMDYGSGMAQPSFPPGFGPFPSYPPWFMGFDPSAWGWQQPDFFSGTPLHHHRRVESPSLQEPLPLRPMRPSVHKSVPTATASRPPSHSPSPSEQNILSDDDVLSIRPPEDDPLLGEHEALPSTGVTDRSSISGDQERTEEIPFTRFSLAGAYQAVYEALPEEVCPRPPPSDVTNYASVSESLFWKSIAGQNPTPPTVHPLPISPVIMDSLEKINCLNQENSTLNWSISNKTIRSLSHASAYKPPSADKASGFDLAAIASLGPDAQRAQISRPAPSSSVPIPLSQLELWESRERSQLGLYSQLDFFTAAFISAF